MFEVTFLVLIFELGSGIEIKWAFRAGRIYASSFNWLECIYLRFSLPGFELGLGLLRTLVIYIIRVT